jgi:hypothetical protein
MEYASPARYHRALVAVLYYRPPLCRINLPAAPDNAHWMVPAAIWSVYALSQYNTDKKIERALSNRV